MTHHDGQSAGQPSSYRVAFDRIRAEYLEMPGMRLSPQQVQRLTGVDLSVCATVLDDLVRARLLQRACDGTYLRAQTDGPARALAARSAGRHSAPKTARP